MPDWLCNRDPPRCVESCTAEMIDDVSYYLLDTIKLGVTSLYSKCRLPTDTEGNSGDSLLAFKCGVDLRSSAWGYIITAQSEVTHSWPSYESIRKKDEANRKPKMLRSSEDCMFAIKKSVFKPSMRSCQCLENGKRVANSVLPDHPSHLFLMLLHRLILCNHRASIATPTLPPIHSIRKTAPPSITCIPYHAGLMPMHHSFLPHLLAKLDSTHTVVCEDVVDFFQS